MNYTLSTLIVALFLSCGSTKSIYSSKDISVISSSKQITHPGVQGVPSNENYTIKIKILKKGISLFGDAYLFNNKGEEYLGKDKIRVFLNDKPLNGAAISKGDLLSLYISRAIYHDSDEMEAPVTTSEIPVDNDEKAEVILTYQKNGKEFKLGLKDVLKQETLYAP